MKKLISNCGLYRCPACGYYDFNGIECYACGFTISHFLPLCSHKLKGDKR